MKKLMEGTPDKDITKVARSLGSAMSYILCFTTPLCQIPSLSILNTPPLALFFPINPIISFCFGRKIVLSTTSARFLFQASSKGRSKFCFALVDCGLQCNEVRIIEIEIRMGAGHGQTSQAVAWLRARQYVSSTCVQVFHLYVLLVMTNTPHLYLLKIVGRCV